MPTRRRHPRLLTAHAVGWGIERSAGEVRVFYGDRSDTAQYAALHLRDGYLRLNAGPGCGWGTSVVLLPVFWHGGRCFHGAPVAVDWRERGRHLLLSVAGEIGALSARLTVALSPPGEGCLVADVRVRVIGSPPLDGDRPAERFKAVMLSSMHASSDLWDAHTAELGPRRLPMPREGWVVPPAEAPKASTFGLVGGTSRWKANAPTVRIALDRRLAVTGWVTRSDDPNDDSVGLWAAADGVLPAYGYRITASLP